MEPISVSIMDPIDVSVARARMFAELSKIELERAEWIVSTKQAQLTRIMGLFTEGATSEADVRDANEELAMAQFDYRTAKIHYELDKAVED